MQLKTITFLGSILLFFILTFPVKAQDTTVVRILTAKDDTTKVIKLAKYAWKLADKDKQKALKLYQIIIDISKKLNYHYGIGLAWLDIGYINGNSANDKVAIQNFKTAIPYFKKANKVSDVAACLLNMGACSERIGDIDTRIKNTMEAINLLENTSHKPMLSQAYYSMGVMFYNQNKFKKAQQYFAKALPIAKAVNDTTKQVNALFGLSNCSSSLKYYAKAYDYSKQALLLAQASGKDNLLIVAHTSMAELFIKSKNAKPVIQHAEQVLKHASAIDATHYQLIAYLNLSEGYNLANNQLKRIHYLNQALEIGRDKGITIQLDDIYKSLSDAYVQLNQPKTAFDYYKKYTVYKDSTNNVKDNKTIAELEIRYQTAQKEKAISENKLQIAQKDLQLQKTWQYTIYSIATALMAFLTASLVYLNFRNKKKIHARQLQTVQQEKEIQVLEALMQGEEKERSRIAKDLHDGVAGMLAATKMHIGSLSLQYEEVSKTQCYHQAVNLLDEASREVRKTAHNLMPEMLMQHGLDEALRRYCHNISNDKMLVVQYDSWGDIKRYKDSFELSVYRIVQELLNNIMKHSKASYALVQVSQNNHILSTTIEDNGIGFNRNEMKSDGMGLHSLQSRVKAINGKLEVEAETGSGVSAYLEFETSGLEV